jgi:hypothetical protein
MQLLTKSGTVTVAFYMTVHQTISIQIFIIDKKLHLIFKNLITVSHNEWENHNLGKMWG